MSEKKGAFQSGILDLSVAVPKLPKVRFPSGTEVQLQHFTADAYERFRRLRRLYSDAVQGTISDDDMEELIDVADDLLHRVLPEATDDDLASLGFRMEARLAPIFAVAGEVDSVVAMLVQASGGDTEEAEGKATEG